VCLALVFGSPFIYDALYKSPLAANARNAAIVSYVLVAVMILLMKYWGGFSYRGYNIHVGAMFGTIMAFNVWFRIWPAQQKIIRAVKAGEAPDPALVALAGMRSRHNTYMSVPLIFTMISNHYPTMYGNPYRDVCLASVIALGFFVTWLLYKKAAKVPGM